MTSCDLPFRSKSARELAFLGTARTMPSLAKKTLDAGGLVD